MQLLTQRCRIHTLTLALELNKSSRARHRLGPAAVLVVLDDEAL